jgi:hypothetical protein
MQGEGDVDFQVHFNRLPVQHGRLVPPPPDSFDGGDFDLTAIRVDAL